MGDSANWGRCRKRRIFRLRLGLWVGTLIGASWAEMALLLAVGGPAALAAFTASLSAPQKLTAACGVQDSAACHLAIPPWALAGLLAGPVVIAAAVGWFKGGPLAETLDDRLFAKFDLGRFDPIGGSRDAAGAQAPLGWIHGRGALRLATWERLIAFTIGGGLQGSSTRFAWTILTGQPGIGKSRMAEELARLLGESDYPDRPRGRGRFRQWLGRALPFLSTQLDDLWHVGRIPHRLGSHDVGIAGWRPTRPTLLLLDDPAPGECDDWIADFRAQCEAYRFPVRLLIVNQSRAIRERTEAESDRLDALGTDARFGPAEIRDLLKRLSEDPEGEKSRGPAIRGLLYPDEAMAPLMELTRGNPFLVELCIDWARDRVTVIGTDKLSPEMRTRLVEALNSLTAQDLIRDRAGRVVKALAAAGVSGDDPPKLHAIAAATLVGPRARRRPIVDALHAQSLPQGPALRRIVPADTRFDDLTELPCILPHAIGDVAVQLMLQPEVAPAVPEDHRAVVESISAAGFLASPSGWMRAQGRFGGRRGLVAEALRTLPPLASDAPLALREEMANAFMELGLYGRVAPDQAADAFAAILDGADSEHRPALVERLDGRLAALLAADHRVRRDSLLGATPAIDVSDEDEIENPAHRFIHPLPLGAIGAILIARSRLASIAKLLWLIEEINQRAASGNLELIGEFNCWRLRLAEVLAHPAINGVELAGILPYLAIGDRNWPEFFLCNAIVDAMEREALDLGSTLSGALAFAIAFADDVDRCRQWADRLEEWVARDCPDDFHGQLYKVAAWLCVIANTGTDIPARQDIVERIGRLADGPEYPGFAAGHGMFRRAHAVALDDLSLSLAEAGDKAGWAEAIAKLEVIACDPEFREDIVVQLAHVNSVSRAAAADEDIVEARRTVARVDDLVARSEFAGERRFILARLDARRLLAAWLTDELPTFREVVDDAERLASPDLFAMDRDVQCERAMLYATLAFVSRKDIAACRKAVMVAEEIGARPAFAGDPMIQAERARAWRNLANATRSNPAACRTAAQRAEAVVTNDLLSDTPAIVEQYAAAWGHAANALVDDVPACREVAERLDRIATEPRWSANEEVQRSAAVGWAHLSRACAQIDDRRGCEAAAASAERTAEPWPANAELQMSRANAWRNVVFARRRDGPAAREALARVEAIGARFPDDPDISLEVRTARGFLGL